LVVLFIPTLNFSKNPKIRRERKGEGRGNPFTATRRERRKESRKGGGRGRWARVFTRIRKKGKVEEFTRP
jgi:hypothetical protein